MKTAQTTAENETGQSERDRSCSLMSISAGEHPERTGLYSRSLPFTVRSALRKGLDKSYVSCIYECDGMHAKGVLLLSSVHCPSTARRGPDMAPEL